LIHQERTSLLDLVFDDEKQMKLFVTGLQILIKEVQLGLMKSIIQSKEALLNSLWAEFDLNGDHKLDRNEISLLFQKINYNCDASSFEEKFKQYDLDKSGFLDF
jgi:Ca2+-binding EF-hand superfamily protein